jgi:hypothetical protein
VVLAYIDKDGYIFRSTGSSRDYGLFDEILNSNKPRWSGYRVSGVKDVSAMAMVGVENYEKFYYIDAESQLGEAFNTTSGRLGYKTAKGSNLAATRPPGTSSIHIFFMSEDLSLMELHYDGKEWQPGRIPPLFF